jgi:hypothetical protein
VPKLLNLLFVSAVVMGLSHTIARERICAGLRARLGGKETFLGYLVSCPYCVSHWLAFLLVPATGVDVIEVVTPFGALRPVLRWLLSSILVAVIAAFLRVAFYFVDEAQGLVRREERLADVAISAREPRASAPARSSPAVGR